MTETTARLRQLWKKYECDEDNMVVVAFCGDRIRVAPETAPAWDALAAVLTQHGYRIRTADTDSYNCRNIKGTDQKSLHSFGIALDINWATNPWIDHPGTRKARFSNKGTQAERAEDVRLGQADTDFTEAIIQDVMAIKTKEGKTVFEWGGHYKTVKDCMHFEIDVGPEELENGVDTNTVTGWEAYLEATRRAFDTDVHALITDDDLPALPELPDLPSLPAGAMRRRSRAMAAMSRRDRGEGLPDLPPLPGLPDLPGFQELPELERIAAPRVSARGDLFFVNARDGLVLRTGPGTNFNKIKTLPFRTAVFVVARDDAWAQVDLEGDGAADGFVHSSFLIAGPGEHAVPERRPSPAVAVGRDITGLVTAEMVKSIFPAATSLNKIRQNLPFVLSGLRARALVDKPMVLMALATIRAETEGFVPISEGISRHNTRNSPFDLYDFGTSKGRDLGNIRRGDGPRFKGRGYVQLTGRFNYEMIGRQIGQSLGDRPDLANDPSIAGLILAQFLSNKEGAIRRELASSNLAKARKLVNGGAHGLDRFKDTFNRGVAVLPN